MEKGTTINKFNGRCCVYLRVSTTKQGARGLGIEAQRKMCDDFISSKGGIKECEFIDVESGAHRDRKGLWKAIDYCKQKDASLIIAKLDRLSRDVEFTFRVINTGIDIHFTDMPILNSMVLGVFASVAQYERELISSRTKNALNAKKERGELTGGASLKWKESYYNKTLNERKILSMQRGQTKRLRYLESRDVVAFTKILKRVFPDETNADDMRQWKWGRINTKHDNRIAVLSLMRDYKDVDNTLFPKWDFTNIESTPMQVKLATFIKTLKESVMLPQTLNT